MKNGNVSRQFCSTAFQHSIPIYEKHFSSVQVCLCNPKMLAFMVLSYIWLMPNIPLFHFHSNKQKIPPPLLLVLSYHKTLSFPRNGCCKLTLNCKATQSSMPPPAAWEHQAVNFPGFVSRRSWFLYHRRMNVTNAASDGKRQRQLSPELSRVKTPDSTPAVEKVVIFDKNKLVSEIFCARKGCLSPGEIWK